MTRKKAIHCSYFLSHCEYLCYADNLLHKLQYIRELAEQETIYI